MQKYFIKSIKDPVFCDCFLRGVCWNLQITFVNNTIFDNTPLLGTLKGQLKSSSHLKSMYGNHPLHNLMMMGY